MVQLEVEEEKEEEWRSGILMAHHNPLPPHPRTLEAAFFLLLPPAQDEKKVLTLELGASRCTFLPAAKPSGPRNVRVVVVLVVVGGEQFDSCLSNVQYFLAS